MKSSTIHISYSCVSRRYQLPFGKAKRCGLVVGALLLICANSVSAQQLPMAQGLKASIAQYSQGTALPEIKKPKSVNGAPAADGLSEKVPELSTVEALDEWLLRNRRATWRYFDRLEAESKAKVLAQYQSYPDTNRLTENVLRTYWQSRRQASSSRSL